MTITNRKLYEGGLKVRREVLGAEYVDPNMAAAEKDPAARAIQDMVNEYCWGYGWTRPGLPKKTRSMLNLVLLMALGKPNELKAHVRGARRNGVTKKEIIEILIHGTIYCGIPAGVDAFRNAREALDQWDAEQREKRSAARRKTAVAKRKVARGKK